MIKQVAVFFLTFCFSTFVAAQIRQAEKSPKAGNESETQAQKNNDKETKNAVEGAVKLKVVFLATGRIGDIVFISAKTKDGKDFDDGLIKQATEAAKKIKFEPAKRNGKPITITKTVTYTFTIY